VGLVVLAVSAYFGYRRLTFWDRGTIAWLRPVDEHRAIIGKTDHDGDRVQLSLVNDDGEIVWSRVEYYGGTDSISFSMVADGYGVQPDPTSKVVTIGFGVALDLADGSVRWRTDHSVAGEVRVVRANRGQLIVIASHERTVVSPSGEHTEVLTLDASTGTELWRTAANTGGMIRAYWLFDDALLVVGRRAVLVDRGNGRVRDAGLGDVNARFICSVKGRVVAFNRAGALLIIEVDKDAPATEIANVGQWLCPTGCQPLACALRGDEIILAAGRATKGAALPTPVRIVGVEPGGGTARWKLELPATGRARAMMSNTFRDFVPLQAEVPRFVPFRVADEIVMVDLDQHAIAYRAPGRRNSLEWSLMARKGRFYARDGGLLGVFDGQTGKLAASVYVWEPVFAGERIWFVGTQSRDSARVVGQLDARTLEPRPGSAPLISDYRKGAWVDGW